MFLKYNIQHPSTCMGENAAQEHKKLKRLSVSEGNLDTEGCGIFPANYRYVLESIGDS